MVKESHPSLYKQAMEERHVLKYGEHYDEEKAREAVAAMSSTDVSGQPQAGEHWTIDQVIEAARPYQSRLHECVTIWDVYVALQMWWHDLGKNYMRRGDREDAIIEDALTWCFFDEDAPDGKLWRYLHAML